MTFTNSPPTSSLPTRLAQRRQRHWLAVGLTVAAIVGLSSLGIFVSRNLVGQVQDLNSKAAPATTLSLTSPTTEFEVGETFTVNVVANTGANVVKALDVNLRYDPAVLQLVDMTKGSWLTQAQEAVKTIDQTNGTGLLGLVILPTANPAYVTGQGVAMTATFRTLSPASQTTISFNTPSTLAGAANERQNVVSSYADLALVVTTVDEPDDSDSEDDSPLKQCNQSCSNSDECDTDLICDGGHCRREDNLSNGQCAAPLASPDNGLQRECNEYCANDSECGSEFKCWWNQCRLTQNLTDANCQLPPTPAPTAQPTARPTREPIAMAATLAPTVKVLPTQITATVSARVIIKASPTPLPTKIAQAKTINDFPTTAPAILTAAPTPPVASSSGGLMSWIPAVLGIVLVGVAALFFGPQIKAHLSTKPPMPPVPPQSPATPAQTLSPTAPPKVHFGTPVDFRVSSKQVPKA